MRRAYENPLTFKSRCDSAQVRAWRGRRTRTLVDVQEPETHTSQDGGDRQDKLALNVAMYTLARIAIVAVLTVVLVLLGVPLLVAVLVSLVAGLPLSMLVLRGLRGRVSEGLAVRFGRRRRERERLRAELRGEQ